jgi:hypothetical protein
MPLPKPNAVVKHDTDFRNLTEAEIRGMIANPIYAGVGPYPAMVTDEKWVSTAVKAIKEDGPEQFLANVLFVLRESLKPIDFEILRKDDHEQP